LGNIGAIAEALPPSFANFQNLATFSARSKLMSEDHEQWPYGVPKSFCRAAPYAAACSGYHYYFWSLKFIF